MATQPENWVIYAEIGVEGDDKDKVISVGMVELKAGTRFVPCGEGPTTFRLEAVGLSFERAKEHYERREGPWR